MRSSWTSVVLALLFAAGGGVASPAGFSDWTMYGGDPTGAKYSSLAQINRTNVQRLKPAWIFRCDDLRLEPASTIECNPIVIGGVMYLTTPGLKVVALDAASGRRQWVFDPWEGRGGRGVNRGVAYWASAGGGEARILFVGGPFLYALEPPTGQPVKGVGADGVVEQPDRGGRVAS